MKKLIYFVALLFVMTPLQSHATEQERHERAVLGATYLAASVGTDGKFVYRYDPKLDEELGGYNILRHAGSIYSMLEVYEVTEDEELLDAIERALTYLAAAAKECPDTPNAMCIVEDDVTKLGGNGLALLAFAKYELVVGNDHYHTLAEELAAWILATQEKGEFTKHKMQAASGEVEPFTSLYYPGEAMYGLMTLYAITGDKKLLTAVQEGSQFLIDSRKKLYVVDLPHDHWFLYALNELHKVDPQEKWVKEVKRLSWAIMLEQHKDRQNVPHEYVGGWGNPPRVATVATRVEGLRAACEVTARANESVTRNAVSQAIDGGAAFLMRLQFTDDRILKLNLSPRARGGFPLQEDTYEIRNDFVQHAVSALMHSCPLKSNEE